MGKNRGKDFILHTRIIVVKNEALTPVCSTTKMSTGPECRINYPIVYP